MYLWFLMSFIIGEWIWCLGMLFSVSSQIMYTQFSKFVLTIMMLFIFHSRMYDICFIFHQIKLVFAWYILSRITIFILTHTIPNTSLLFLSFCYKKLFSLIFKLFSLYIMHWANFSACSLHRKYILLCFHDLLFNIIMLMVRLAWMDTPLLQIIHYINFILR